MRSRIAWMLPVAAAACVPALERTAPSPLLEATGIEQLRVHGTVVVPFDGLDPPSARDFALRQVSQWAGEKLFAAGQAALGGRYLRVTTRAAPADPGPVVVADGRTLVPVDVVLRGPAPRASDLGPLPRRLRVDTSGCVVDCEGLDSELVIELAPEPPASGSLQSLWRDGVLDVDVFFLTWGARGPERQLPHDLGLATSELLERWGLRVESTSSTPELWTRVLSREVEGAGIERVRLFDYRTPPPGPDTPPPAALPLTSEIAEALRTRDVVILCSSEPPAELASASLAGSKDQLVFVEGPDPVGAGAALGANPRRDPAASVWFVGVLRDVLNNLAVGQLLGVLVGPNRRAGDPRALDDGMHWDALDHVHYTLHRFTGPGALP